MTNPVAIERREALKRIAKGFVAVAAFPWTFNFVVSACDKDEVTSEERAHMARLATALMREFGLPGMSVAIAIHGRTIYTEGFGLANRETREKVSGSSSFRIASITKPITSVAIFSLVEQGKLRLNDRVFGKNGILAGKYGRTHRKYVEDITVDHLLSHTCGGWENGAEDPMFLDQTASVTQLISWTIEHRSLTFPPGSHWAYSNFGYCVLGRVIEAISGSTYEEWVRKAILAPLGISMQISGNTLEERAREEVVYYGQKRDNPYNMNVRRMDSNGGWLSTSKNLVHFAASLADCSGRRLLTADTVKAMTAPVPVNANYARGWALDKQGDWFHTGGLPGTTGILERTSTGFCWAALTNTSQANPGTIITAFSGTMISALRKMLREMAGRVKCWHAK